MSGTSAITLCFSPSDGKITTTFLSSVTQLLLNFLLKLKKSDAIFLPEIQRLADVPHVHFSKNIHLTSLYQKRHLRHKAAAVFKKNIALGLIAGEYACRRCISPYFGYFLRVRSCVFCGGIRYSSGISPDFHVRPRGAFSAD